MDDPASQIADRRRQWAQLTPAQRLQRIQAACAACLDHAEQRRQRRRAQRVMATDLPKEWRDYAIA